MQSLSQTVVYIGETKQRLKDRFNEHHRPIDKQTNSCKRTAVSEHFLSNYHNANDMQLIPLELMKSNRDSVRKAREAYLIDRDQTLEPLGLNRRDDTYTFSSFSSSACIFLGIFLFFFSTFYFRIVTYLEFNPVRYPGHLSLLVRSCHSN